MRHNLDRISENPQDYKLCSDERCGAVNWYENATCVLCGADSLETVPNDAIVNFCQDYADGYCADEYAGRFLDENWKQVDVIWENILLDVR